MKRTVTLFAFLFLMGLCGSGSATTINFDHAVTSDGNGFTSPYAGVSVQTFDNVSPGLLPSGYTGDGGIVQRSLTNFFAAPFGVSAPDATKYLAVPIGFPSNGTLTVSFNNSSYNYLGLWWGSIDSYNKIAFYYNGVLTAQFSGSNILYPNPANGNQTSHMTNVYVNFLDLPTFNSFSLSSGDYAFEVDNVAVGNVPEPLPLLLVGTGIAGLAILQRLRRKTA